MIEPSQDPSVVSVLRDTVEQTGAPVPELTSVSHVLDPRPGALVALLSEPIVDGGTGSTRLFKGLARRALKALTLEREVLEKAWPDRGVCGS